ncbi:MAG: hypothetical protein IT546_11210 [Caulobacteraceae bacterium]|nr:hypothetical protein [Caulobacteraceae bacterium]
MRTAARLIARAFWIFLGLYAAALAIFVIFTFGLFGQDKVPLAGIFLILLGVPWVQLGGVPDAVGPWFAVIAPVGNLAPLAWAALFARRMA